MNVTSVMSLVAATVFAVGVVGPAVAQTPSTPAPAKSGDMQMDKDKDAKKDKAAAKKKKKKAAKKTEGETGKAPEPKK